MYLLKKSCQSVQFLPQRRDVGMRVDKMKKIILTLFILCLCNMAFCQNKIPVFVSGTDGYKSFRIPAVIAAPDGSLLAFAEGRVHGSGDFGNIDIVMKKSKDKGKHGASLKLW